MISSCFRTVLLTALLFLHRQQLTVIQKIIRINKMMMTAIRSRKFSRSFRSLVTLHSSVNSGLRAWELARTVALFWISFIGSNSVLSYFITLIIFSFPFLSLSTSLSSLPSSGSGGVIPGSSFSFRGVSGVAGGSTSGTVGGSTTWGLSGSDSGSNALGTYPSWMYAVRLYDPLE